MPRINPAGEEKAKSFPVKYTKRPSRIWSLCVLLCTKIRTSLSSCSSWILQVLPTQQGMSHLHVQLCEHAHLSQQTWFQQNPTPLGQNPAAGAAHRETPVFRAELTDSLGDNLFLLSFGHTKQRERASTPVPGRGVGEEKNKALYG